MTDKLSIQGRNALDITQSKARAVDAAKSNKASESSQRAESTRDDVRLTDTATRLKQIEAKLGDIPEVDQARVDEIRQRLESDAYEVDHNKLAQKLLQLEQDLT